MSSDKMREEFEAELCKMGYGEIYRAADPASSVEYENGYFQFGWTMFKASRETLVIELPEAKELEVSAVGCTYHDSFLDHIEVVEAIESAGVNWKVRV